jgi:putative acetyltransferase
MIIRLEQSDDAEAIGQVTRAAFIGKAYSSQTEHLIVGRLRAAGALFRSLVAQDGCDIIGHVGFSAVEIEDGSAGWFGLGPLSVRPDRQREGIGTALVKQGLADLAALGAAGCVLVGSPKFYPRFGFRPAVMMLYPGAPVQYFMVLPLRGQEASGIVRFHPAFYGSAA